MGADPPVRPHRREEELEHHRGEAGGDLPPKGVSAWWLTRGADLHNIVKDDPWLLDPRWNLLGDEVPLSSLDIDFTAEADAETGRPGMRPGPTCPWNGVSPVRTTRLGPSSECVRVYRPRAVRGLCFRGCRLLVERVALGASHADVTAL